MSSRSLRLICIGVGALLGVLGMPGVAAANSAPVITLQPTDVVASPGQTVRLFTAASGTPTPTVQWMTFSCLPFCTPVSVPGATSPTFTFTMPSGSSPSYWARYTNASGTVSTRIANSTTVAAPTATLASAPSTTFLPGQSSLLTVTVTGRPSPTVKWQDSFDDTTWTDIAGATTTSYTAGPFTSSDNGRRFRLVATNATGSAITTSSVFTQAVAPTVTAQPSDLFLANGQPVGILSVSSSGLPAPSTQWQVSTDGGVTWADTGQASTAQPNTFGVGTTAHGVWDYRAVITNVAGTVTSTVARVRVEGPPSVTSTVTMGPSSVAVGGTIELSASATGLPTPTVQWSRRRSAESTFTDIPGATTSPYSYVTSANDSNATFRATFTNSRGSASRDTTSLLQVVSPATISSHPTSRAVGEGSLTSFSATTGGNSSATYWQISADGGQTWIDTPPTGTGSSTIYTVFPVTLDMDGTWYRAVFTNIAGVTRSNWAVLTVQSRPLIAVQPSDTTVADGSAATFSATATGGVVSAQWFVSTDGGGNYTTVAGGTLSTVGDESTATLSVPATGGLNGNRYRVVFSKSVAGATSAAAKLTVTSGPTITVQPSARAVARGSSATFTATANGPEALTAAWQRSNDGGVTWADVGAGTTALTASGATAASLTVGPLTGVDHNARFRVVFTGALGSATSNPATLSVAAFTSEPVAQTVSAGTSVTLSVTANQSTTGANWSASTDNGVTWTSIGPGLSITFAATTTRFVRASVIAGGFQITSTPVLITVTGSLPNISVSPRSTSAMVGELATITASAWGAAGTTATWNAPNGTEVTTTTDGVTTSTLTVPATATDASYRVTFTSAAGSVSSAFVQVYGVQITSQPTDQSVLPGNSATFTVATNANAQRSWERSTDGGLTFTELFSYGNDYTVSGANASMDGHKYRAKITSSRAPGVTTYTNVVTLVVLSNTAPNVVGFFGTGTNPVTLSATAGSDAQPDVVFEFSADNGVTWVSLPPVTPTLFNARWNAQLSVPVTLPNSGIYRAAFTNSFGTSRTTTVTIQAPFAPIFTTQPADIAAAHGERVTFTAAVSVFPTGNGIVWEFSLNNGATWAIANSSAHPMFVNCSFSCAIDASMATPRALLRARASNVSGLTYSRVARLDVIGVPVQTSVSLSQLVNVGTNVSVARSVFSSTPVSAVQWQKSSDDGVTWDNVAGGSLALGPGPAEYRSELTVVPAATENYVQYRAQFTNEYGTTNSSVVILDTNVPRVNSSPSNVSITEGFTASFTVSGSFFTSVGWQRSNDGGATWNTIPGATSATYSLTTTANDNGALFRARLVGLGGTAISSSALLSVNFIPLITTQPVNATSVGLAAVSFTTVAVANPAPTVKWQVSTNGGATYSDIPGATSTSLTVTPTGAAMNNYRYRAVYQNNRGTRTSVAAVLTLTAVPQTVSFSAAPPSDAAVNGSFSVAASASSGLAVAYSVAGPCTLSGTTVTATGPGTCSITAGQAGNATYAPAPDVTATVAVAKLAQTITVEALPTSPGAGSTTEVAATASSGLVVALAASGGCSLVGTTLTFTTPGAVCSLTANQGGDDTFAPAPQVVVETTVVYATQTITFDELPSDLQPGSTFDVAATASSGLPVTYAAAGSCTISGVVVSVGGSGTCSITASQPGNETYAAAVAVTRSTVVAGIVQSITMTALPVAVALNTSTTVTATASSGLAVSLTATGSCTLSGSLLRFLSTGLCTVAAAQAGNATYQAAPPVSRVTTVKRTQTITFPALPSTVAINTTAELAATAVSGLPVSFVGSGGCSVSGTTVSFNSAATCTVTASQAGDADWLPAAAVVRTTTVRSSQTITIGALPATPAVGTTFALAGTATSGLPVSYTATGGCSVTGSTLRFTTNAPCTVTANQAGNTFFTAAPPVSVSTVAGPGAQNISFTNPPVSVAVGATFNLSATATSGLPVTFAVSGTTCAISGNTVTALAAGPCAITASQSGNASWNAATPVVRTAQVRADQTITFPQMPSSPMVGVTYALGAVATSGLSVGYSVSGSCVLVGVSVRFTSAGAPCTVTAGQTGNTAWNAAPTVTRATTPVPGNQTISVTAFPTNLQIGSTFAVVATSTSGLTVGLAATGSCTLDGTTVTMTGSGVCTVVAAQSGDSNWLPANPVSRTAIVKVDQVIAFDPLPVAPPVGPLFTLRATASSGLGVTYTASGGCTVAGSSLRFTTAGVTCTVVARQIGNTLFNAAPLVTQSTTPVQGTQTISTVGLGTDPLLGSTFTVVAFATSGLPVTVTASGSCSNAGAQVTAVSAGTCTIRLDQAGDSNWSPAPVMIRTMTIRSLQIITFPPLTTPVASGSVIILAATSSSGLAVSYTVSGACTVSGTRLTVTTPGGTCNVSANQAGNATFRPAVSVVQSILVV